MDFTPVYNVGSQDAMPDWLDTYFQMNNVDDEAGCFDGDECGERDGHEGAGADGVVFGDFVFWYQVQR